MKNSLSSFSTSGPNSFILSSICSNLPFFVNCLGRVSSPNILLASSTAASCSSCSLSYPFQSELLISFSKPYICFSIGNARNSALFSFMYSRFSSFSGLCTRDRIVSGPVITPPAIGKPAIMFIAARLSISVCGSKSTDASGSDVGSICSVAIRRSSLINLAGMFGSVSSISLFILYIVLNSITLYAACDADAALASCRIISYILVVVVVHPVIG